MHLSNISLLVFNIFKQADEKTRNDDILCCLHQMKKEEILDCNYNSKVILQASDYVSETFFC